MVDRLKRIAGNKIVAADVVDGVLVLKRANGSVSTYSLDPFGSIVDNGDGTWTATTPD